VRKRGCVGCMALFASEFIAPPPRHASCCHKFPNKSNPPLGVEPLVDLIEPTENTLGKTKPLPGLLPSSPSLIPLTRTDQLGSVLEEQQLGETCRAVG